MELIEIDVVGAEALEAHLAGADDLLPRRAIVVRACAHRHAGLRGDEHLVAPALNRLAKDLLRQASRITVGGVEHVRTSRKSYVDKLGGFLDVGRAPLSQNLAASAEGSRTEDEGRDLQPRSSKRAILHVALPGRHPALP